MAFIDVSDTVQAEFIYSYFGQVMENVLYFKNDTDLDVSSMTALGGVLRDWWDDWYSQQLNGLLQLNTIKLTDLTAVASPVVEFTDGLPLNGKVTSGETLPTQIACCCTLITLSRGRSFRGRIYVPGIPDAAITNSTFTDTFIADMEGNLGQLMVALDDTNFVWGVVSRYTGGAPRASGVFTQISGFRVNATAATQRRRRLGVGM